MQHGARWLVWGDGFGLFFFVGFPKKPGRGDVESEVCFYLPLMFFFPKCSNLKLNPFWQFLVALFFLIR